MHRLVAAACLAASAASAKTTLIIATHPDDEIMIAAGRIRAALDRGETVKVVLVTNGDAAGEKAGVERQGYTISGAQTLGLTEDDVIFLGYPDDGLRDVYESPASRVYTSHSGRSATWASRGYGRTDFHQKWAGSHAPYSSPGLLADFRSLLTTFKPDEIYTHSDFEAHRDHQATALALVDAITALRRSGSPVAPRLYQTIVWMPRAGADPDPKWPQVDPSGKTVGVPYLPWSSGCAPGDCLDLTSREWSRVLRFQQPRSMQVEEYYSNLKAKALDKGDAWFKSFVRADEFFWLTDFEADVAVIAAASASSGDASRAIDGVVAGAPAEPSREWVSRDGDGAWLQLDWPQPMRIAQVNLHGRPGKEGAIQEGMLSFGDGSSIPVGALPAGGRLLPLLFPPKTVTRVRFTASRASAGAGLAEIEVLGAPAKSTVNHAPNFVFGPAADADVVPAQATVNVSALANDIDGDALTYTWSCNAGHIEGNGPKAVFRAPRAMIPYATITVQVRDSRGAAASNSTVVSVVQGPGPLVSSLLISPAMVGPGDTAVATVRLDRPSPAPGVQVELASSDAAAEVPRSVTIAAGKLEATFPIKAGPKPGAAAIISAARAGSTRSAAWGVRR